LVCSDILRAREHIIIVMMQTAIIVANLE